MKQIIILALAAFTAEGALAQQKGASSTRIQDSRIWFYPDQPGPQHLVRSKLLFFPNPAQEQTRVHVKDMPDELAGGGYTMQVYNADGKQVQSRGWSAGQLLDVSGLADGLYIVTVRKGDLLFSEKLVIKR